MKRFSGLQLGLGMADATLFAQAGGNISGVVSDPSGAAIPGAVVMLKRSAAQGVRVAKANSEGFDSTRLPARRRTNYDVSASAAGFETQVAHLTMAIGSELNFTLRIGPFVILHIARPARPSASCDGLLHSR